MHPLQKLLTACGIVIGLALTVNYFLRVSNRDWEESKGYLQYYMEQHGVLSVAWFAGAAAAAWMVLLVTAFSRRHDASRSP
jgi:hypothetical protein